MKWFFSALLTLLAAMPGTSHAQRAMKTETLFRQPFPQGDKLPGQFSPYFIGQAYLHSVSDNDTLGMHLSNVTFSPACRNNWHSHTGGQLLLCTAGRGYYQEQGQPARELLPGDAVEIAPDVVHWHGAAPDSWFAHLAVECNPATNENSWFGPVDEAQYAAATASRASDASDDDPLSALRQADPELAQAFARFAFDEVPQHGLRDARTRSLLLVVCSVARQAEALYRAVLPEALDNGATPVEIREALFHAIPYAGMATVLDFVGIAEEVFAARGIALPLQGQATTDSSTRYDAGLTLQKRIFGERIERMQAAAPEGQRHLQRFLSANCFGDYQTRTGLDVKTRELLTYAILISLGGCEAQVESHIAGNAAVGNDKATLLAATTVLLPWNGYPRTLNAVACLNEVLPEPTKP